jgi:hypothetical protein
MPHFLQALLGLVLSLVVGVSSGVIPASQIQGLAHISPKAIMALLNDHKDATQSATPSAKPHKKEKFEATNSASGKLMPTHLPLKALEHSRVLKATDSATMSAKLKDKEGSEEAEDHDNGRSHGKETSENARNSHR